MHSVGLLVELLQYQLPIQRQKNTRRAAHNSVNKVELVQQVCSSAHLVPLRLVTVKCTPHFQRINTLRKKK